MGGGAASGKVGAMVASHNSGGQYVRARTTPTNPNTTFQQAVRNAVRSLTAAWNQILGSQRDAWAVYGRNTTFKNRLGDTIQLSGIAAYVRSNTPRLQAGLTRIDDAPTIFDVGEVQAPPMDLVLGTTTGTLTLDPTADWITAGTAGQNSLLVYLSRPQNVGVTFFKGPFQLAGTLASNGAGTAGAYALTLPFAVDPAVGQQVFGQVRVSRGDARLSSTFQFFGET